MISRFAVISILLLAYSGTIILGTCLGNVLRRSSVVAEWEPIDDDAPESMGTQESFVEPSFSVLPHFSVLSNSKGIAGSEEILLHAFITNRISPHVLTLPPPPRPMAAI